jgi:DNA-binding response OmpR family regulator
MSVNALRPPRVLILEDRRDSAAFLCSLFASHSFEAASTSTVAAAVDSVIEESVAVVVPAYTGDATATVAAIADIRSHPDGVVRDVAVVALVDDPWAAERCVEAGADAVLVRPVHSSRLVASASRAAATRPANRAARRTATP